MDNILENLLKRSPNQYGSYQDKVTNILDEVKENGDEALFSLTKEYDKAEINKQNIRVTEEEIKEAYSLVDDSLIHVMKTAAQQLDGDEGKRRNCRAANDASRECRRIRPRGKSGLPF